MIIERLLLTVILMGIGIIAYVLYCRYQLARMNHKQEVDPLLQDLQDGVPTIVYFTTPGCIPCKTQQQPALKRLHDALGARVQILQIDATEAPDAAQRWGVMTAPTTFVLDRSGRLETVNHGYADEHKLLRQLEAVNW